MVLQIKLQNNANADANVDVFLSNLLHSNVIIIICHEM